MTETAQIRPATNLDDPKAVEALIDRIDRGMVKMHHVKSGSDGVRRLQAKRASMLQRIRFALRGR